METHTTAAVSQNTQADKIFFSVFYVCLGFLTTAIGVFGRSAFQIPFFIISSLLCLRLLMRSDCRLRMSRMLYSNELRVLLALAVVLTIYAFIGILGSDGQTRLLGKPITIVFGALLLAFVWSYKDILDSQLLFRGLFYGVIGGVAGVAAVSLWQWTVMQSSAGGELDGELPIKIFALNDELKILSVFVFLTVAGITTQFNRIFLCVCIAIAVFTLSFYTLGTYEMIGRPLAIGHTSSEAVQFGLPIAVLVLLFAAIAPKFMTHAVFLGVGFVVISAPWLFQYWYYLANELDLPRAKKFLVRAEIWNAASREALMKPFWGHGLDGARTENLLTFEQKYFKSSKVLHPHNMFVQIWLDMGLVGVAFALAICFFAWRGVCKIPLNLRPLILASVVMYVLFALVTHSVWKTWSMILLLMMFALISLLTQKKESI